MLQEKTVINDCYILQARIGEDSYTEHWLATAIFSARRFLLRFLRENCNSDEAVAGLRADAMKCYQVRGPSICDFVELEFYQTRLFISSEYYGETNLLRLLDSGARWSLGQICKFMIELADGLASFHSQGIVYGNLDAECVVLPEHEKMNPEMKIRKPGMMALLSVTDADERTGRVSLAYIAPEYKNSKDLTARSDVYSLGIHLVRFITGRFPYAGNTNAVKKESASLRFVSVSFFRRNIPEGLVRIAVKALMADPEKRYGSCAEMIRDIRAFMITNDVMQNGIASDVGISGSSNAFDSSIYFETLEIESAARNASSLNRFVPTDNYPLAGESSNELEKEALGDFPGEETWTADDYIEYGLHVVSGKAIPEKSSVAESQKLQAIAPASGADSREDSFPLRNFVVTPVAASGTVVANAPVSRSAYMSAADPIGQTPTIMAAGTEGAVPRDAVRNAEPDESAKKTALKLVAETSEMFATDPVPVSRQTTPGTKLSVQEKAETGSAISVELDQIVSDEIVTKNEQTWTRHRIRINDVKSIIERSAKHARAGKGSFRYIQEPQTVYSGSGLFDLLESLGDRYLYVNTGSCNRYGMASVSDFLEMLQLGLFRAMQAETRGGRAYLGTKVSKQDTCGLFEAPPLGSVLYGRTRAPVARKVYNPVVVESDIVRSIRAFGRKSRPFLLVVRGGENITRELHDLFTLIAGNLSDVPVCMVVFFEDKNVESWHTLSALARVEETRKFALS